MVCKDRACGGDDVFPAQEIFKKVDSEKNSKGGEAVGDLTHGILGRGDGGVKRHTVAFLLFHQAIRRQSISSQ